jgi:hypothetical protein
MDSFEAGRFWLSLLSSDIDSSSTLLAVDFSNRFRRRRGGDSVETMVPFSHLVVDATPLVERICTQTTLVIHSSTDPSNRWLLILFCVSCVLAAVVFVRYLAVDDAVVAMAMQLLLLNMVLVSVLVSMSVGWPIRCTKRKDKMSTVLPSITRAHGHPSLSDRRMRDTLYTEGFPNCLPDFLQPMTTHLGQARVHSVSLKQLTHVSGFGSLLYLLSANASVAKSSRHTAERSLDAMLTG